MKFGSSNSECCSTTHAGTATGSKEVSVIVVPTELNGVQVPPRLKRVFRLNAIARCDSHVARHLVLHRSGRPGNCSVIVALPSPAEHFLRGLKGSLFLPIHSRDRATPPHPADVPPPNIFRQFNIMAVRSSSAAESSTSIPINDTSPAFPTMNPVTPAVTDSAQLHNTPRCQ
jgi:hypothetical protein